MKNRSGFTLLETVLAIGLTTMLILSLVKLSPVMYKFFIRGQARHQATMEARRCMETIERVMTKGKANTLILSTPATIPVIPRSQVQFSTVDGSTYTITWSDTPMNTVHLLRIPPGGGTVQDTTIGTRVTTLMFDIPDAADPALVTVALQIVVPVGAAGTADSTYTINLPPKTVEMIAF